MQATTLSETLAEVRKRSAAKLAALKQRPSVHVPPPPLTEGDKALVEEAAKLGEEWRARANKSGW